jgi:hypothetical protein
VPATRSGEQCLWLHRGGHSEFGESWQIVGVQAFDVDDAVPSVTHPVGPRGVLDGIEGEADAGITGGVRVGLEPHSVEFGDDVDQGAAGMARSPAHARAIGVILEHECRVGFDHVVGVELDRPETQHRAGGRAIDGVAQSLPEFAIGSDRVEQCRDHPRREDSLGERSFEQRQFGKGHLGFDYGRDSERGGHAHARAQFAIPTLG